MFTLTGCRQLKSLNGIQHCVNLKKLGISGSHSTCAYFLPAMRLERLFVCASGSSVPDLAIVQHLVQLEELHASSMCFQALTIAIKPIARVDL